MSSNSSRPRPSRGFTLIELLVTIAIAVVLLTIAVPSFVQFQRSSQLTTASNTLLSAISAARGEAMKRGANAMVRPLTDNDWAKGWRIYVDVNRDNVWSDDTDIQVSVGERLPSYISVSTDGTASASSPYLLFDASGYAKTTSGAFSSSTISIRRNDVTGSAVYEQTRRVKIGTSGRMFVCKPASGTDASCAATGD